MGNDDEHLRKAFDFFDKNKSGYIEIEELRTAVACEVDDNVEDVISAIMNDVDTDKVCCFILVKTITSLSSRLNVGLCANLHT